MRVLVVNLTRFGDLLQTQAAISGLARAGCEVGLVCLDNFLGAAKLLRDVAYVKALPGARLLALADEDWKKSVAFLDAWRRELAADFAPDRTVNLTATLGGRLLGRLAAPDRRRPGHELFGFALDAEGFGACVGPWASFLYASTRQRGCSPFNIADLFWQTAGVEDLAPGAPRTGGLSAPDASRVEAVARRLAEQAPAGARGFVGLQLGASEDRRRWPVDSFAALGARLWAEARLVPVLLGSPAEADLAVRYAALAAAGVESPHLSPHLSLVGETGLEDLAAALTRLDLLVTNDTGTMHLAAGLGTPVAAVFLATAQPWDTGPYAEGCLSLEPDLSCHPCAFGAACPNDLACRRAVRPETLAHAVAHRLERGVWPRLTGLRAWESVRDDAGFMDLACLSGHAGEDRTLWVRLQRRVYRRFLDGRDPMEALPGQNDPELFALARGMSPGAVEAIRADMDRFAGLATLLQQQGLLLGRMQGRMLELRRRKFMAAWQQAQTVLDASRYFNVLGLLWATQTQEAGGDFQAVMESVMAYRRLAGVWTELFKTPEPAVADPSGTVERGVPRPEKNALA